MPEPQLWTVSGLSAQLDMDRRTLTRKLKGLRPAATEKRNDGAIVRRYRLNDVLAHLNRDPGAPRDLTGEELTETAERVLGFVGSQLWPGMIQGSFQAVTGGLRDLGLSKPRTIEAFWRMALGLALALERAAGEHPLQLRHPPVLEEIKRLGAEGFVLKHWPK